MNDNQKRHASSLWPIVIFFLCAAFIALTFYVLFEKIKANEKEDTNKTLISVGQLKTNQILSYLDERKADAAVVSSFLFTPPMQHWLSHQSNSTPAILNQLAKSAVTAYQYRGLLVLDSGANIRFITGHSGMLTDAGKIIALRVMRERSPASFQIYFGDPSKPDVPVLDTFVPIMSLDGTKVMGMVVMRSELDYLFKLIQTWPIESKTAESLLVTRDGDDVLFLNELRYQKNTALKLRIPIKHKANARVIPTIEMVGKGRFGLIEGSDYRGHPTLGYNIAVPGTSWGMSVKMDLDEAEEHSLRLQRIAMITASVFIVFIGIIEWLWWRKNKADQLASRQLLEAESRYRRLYESMMDAFVMVDMSGRFLEFNPAYQEMLGYSGEELHRLSCVELTPEKWHEFEARIIEEQVIPYGYSQVYEKEYIRKDGTVFPVEFKAFLLRDDNEQPEAMWAIVRDITERKQAENTLRLHSEILRNLLEGIILVRACDGVIVYTNPQFESMFKYGPGELLGKPVSVINAPGETSQEAVASAINAELVQAGAWSGEVQNIRKDGSVFWCHANVSTFEHPQFGQVWVSVHDDITERKRAEEELQRFFNLIPDLACIASTDGYFLKVNSAWQSVLGFTEQELLSTPFVDFIHPDDRDGTMKEVERQAGGEATLHFINRYRRKDGSYRWLEWQTTPAIGNTLLYATARDITERKQTEERLRKSAEEIEDLYNHAPCGYHSLDRDGIFRQINDTELAWLGYMRNEVIGKMKLTDFLTPASLQTFRETFPQLMQNGFIRDIEAEIIRKDGTAFTGLINATAIYNRSGNFETRRSSDNFVMSRSTIVDITERKQAERKLQELSAHLQTVREEEKANIAREIHDDLGGTLTALKMDTFWLAKHLPADKAAAPLLKRVNSMSQLLDDAVGVTRRVITDLRPSILDDLGLLAALEWNAEQFQNRTGISCRVNCIENIGTLDKQLATALYRIFQETLTNVARHSGANKVEVEFHCDGEEAMLAINDNGKGLPEGHTVASTSFGVRGMCERVEQLGGKIKFDSPPGGGFNVMVIFPLSVEKNNEAKA